MAAAALFGAQPATHARALAQPPSSAETARCAWLRPSGDERLRRAAAAGSRRAQRREAQGPLCRASASHVNGTHSKKVVKIDVLEQQQGEQRMPAVVAAAAAAAAPGEAPPHPQVWTKFVAETLLPTKLGKFRLRGYRHTVDGGITYTEPTVIISGNPEGGADVAVRVHDACFTSEVLGSLKCDCREQLELAMAMIRDQPPGMVIYLQQEGRGIGLANKIAAYALQEKGLDTVDANRALGLPDDCREYSAVAHILEDLGISSIKLMTNNPRKLNELAGLGIPVSGRIPCQVQAQKYNAGYLSSKQRRMSHLLSPELFEASPSSSESEQEALEGQFCFWDHEGEPSSAGIPLEAPVPLPDGLDAAADSRIASSSAAGSPDHSPPPPGTCGSGSSVSASVSASTAGSSIDSPA